MTKFKATQAILMEWFCFTKWLWCGESMIFTRLSDLIGFDATSVPQETNHQNYKKKEQTITTSSKAGLVD